MVSYGGGYPYVPFWYSGFSLSSVSPVPFWNLGLGSAPHGRDLGDRELQERAQLRFLQALCIVRRGDVFRTRRGTCGKPTAVCPGQPVCRGDDVAGGFVADVMLGEEAVELELLDLAHHGLALEAQACGQVGYRYGRLARVEVLDIGADLGKDVAPPDVRPLVAGPSPHLGQIKRPSGRYFGCWAYLVEFGLRFRDTVNG